VGDVAGACYTIETLAPSPVDSVPIEIESVVKHSNDTTSLAEEIDGYVPEDAEGMYGKFVAVSEVNCTHTMIFHSGHTKCSSLHIDHICTYLR
jgi:hypothetical protein